MVHNVQPSRPIAYRELEASSSPQQRLPFQVKDCLIQDTACLSFFGKIIRSFRKGINEFLLFLGLKKEPLPKRRAPVENCIPPPREQPAPLGNANPAPVRLVPQEYYQSQLGPNQNLFVLQGNIFNLPVEAIINAANEGCLGGGGLDAQFVERGGAGLAAQRLALPEVRPGVRCPTGQAVITGSHDIGAPPSTIRHIIHTVGPVYRANDPQVPLLLSEAYRESLLRAHENNLRSIAFPAISGRIFGYPMADVVRIALQTVRQFYQDHPGTALQEVVFVFYGNEDYQTALGALANEPLQHFGRVDA